ncbi:MULTISPECIES: glycoside hydrolase family 76 protein [Arthrobacter]|uniref:Glycoside hydrolase family 76 protein n=2 Tax=Arthrobacter TaxID=1663 RepID=A0ABU9KKH3_9MICC|nr:glycoside hydrolase family 76 protein [Arthrobacter sp. YJM1]MDP5226570.1 glycoside hydrolase family 76 protein [Arthrobacter sp. YJM1]
MDSRFRAAQAAASVIARHGRRLAGLPGTHLGRVVAPGRAFSELGTWHYWWQAHYVDALLDAARRERAPHGPHARLARRVIRTIRLHNAFRYVNSYTDDMAWLGLAAQRLEALDPGVRLGPLHRVIARELEAASTPELGGGSWWSRDRDFKNTPATAPVSLYFARAGRTARARGLVDWLVANLLDAESGLFLDGIHLNRDGGTTVAREIYSYNQGPVLGTLLALGTREDLARAEALVHAVAEHLTRPDGTLITHGPGDGGLFTGILARYLALAALDERLTTAVRGTARSLVTATAGAFWAGRERVADAWVFPGASDVELSSQLQAWMSLEAAARLNESN